MFMEVSILTLAKENSRVFTSLVASFEYAICCRILSSWIEQGLIDDYEVPKTVSKELDNGEFDFDDGLLAFFDDLIAAIEQRDERRWRKISKRKKEVYSFLESKCETKRQEFTILIDSIDDSWDGTDEAVLFLRALMHACVELNANSRAARPYLFLRENMFDRVRETETEFARLETWVESLEWSNPSLLAMIEKRLNRPLNTKLPIDGTTWNHFFEKIEDEPSWKKVFSFCQTKPRDVLAYSEFAIELAQHRNNTRVKIEDLQEARRRFADNRLKDLADEYSENFPRLDYILNLFFGLGDKYTINGLVSLIAKIVADPKVGHLCPWFFDFATPERFAELLYRIGFAGLLNEGKLMSRSMGSSGSKVPEVTSSTLVCVHETFSLALGLQELVIDRLEDEFSLKQTGIITDVPGGVSFDEYVRSLDEAKHKLELVQPGDDHCEDFEEVVGEILKLCFFRWLGNPEPKCRNHSGRVIRDWLTSNIARGGFWEAMRQRYNALSVLWECKNYEKLAPSDFLQTAGYLTPELGGLGIIAFRGDRSEKKHYFEHIQRASHQKQGNCIILLVNDQDLKTFVRQSIQGRYTDNHIRAIYDEVVRHIS
ncbi:P-loop ATPase, Sll1717 family [Roseiconus lacunae]|uniref:P-loop ATPase, Sll1717 family n=1 Tax=Roseiconus lacunae TaxID=2605694 RepID=UPI001358F631|nr:hypothetical protein [Roseiconus lacunae]